jgi:hypothetical protein
MKKIIYKWHRKLSIIAVIPLLAWTASGIMHPIMSTFKPEMAKKFLIPESLETSKIQLEFDSALTLNGIKEYENFRFVSFGEKTYYQIQLPNQFELVYLDSEMGSLLENGDQKYAESLARELSGDIESEVSITIKEKFDHEYSQVFRLLPAYRVAFDRPDGLRVFVETESSRMGSSVNNARANMSWVFVQLHTWEFLNFNENFRISVVLLVTIITLLTALSGLLVYGLFWKGLGNEKPKSKSKKYHRVVGLLMSLSLFGFGISATFHIFPKYNEENRLDFHNNQTYQTSEINFSIKKAIAKSAELGKIFNISQVQMNEKSYLQIFTLGKHGQRISYFDTQSNQKLENGDEQYAQFLANKFGNHSDSEIKETTFITKFKGEYGFVNKRLPVYKVQYDLPNDERIYVETSTGKLGGKIKNKLAVSGFLFAYLHKYHFLDFMGKTVRDVATVFFALGNFLVALLGLLLLLRKSIR